MNTDKKLISRSKTNFATIVALLAVSLGLSACGKDLKSVAKAASKELGVPVVINTDSTDICAEKQLSAMFEQYKDLSKDDQRSAKRLLHASKGINVNGTVNTAKWTGEATYLYLGNSSTRKILTDKRKLDGTAPKTQIDKKEGDAITITTQGAVDDSNKTVYAVFDRSVYDMIDAEDSPVLKKALNTGAAVSRGKTYGPIIDCGTLANVHDLF
ncbi:MAG: hypothetical protein HY074_18100 [Deltaproteobacteria bacterium]|nr:hypothetical protein [Deltaproteobacteria bacterium]